MSTYNIKNLEHYFKTYRKSVKDPKKFWEKIAADNFTWYQKWDKVMDFDFKEAKFEWFSGAKLNITSNNAIRSKKCGTTHISSFKT